MANPFETLLLQNLQTLTDSVDELRRGQDAMKDTLHEKLTELDTRVAGMETSMKDLKTDVKKEARRWGAVGGAFTTAAALLVSALKAALGVRT